MVCCSLVTGQWDPSITKTSILCLLLFEGCKAAALKASKISTTCEYKVKVG